MPSIAFRSELSETRIDVFQVHLLEHVAKQREQPVGSGAVAVLSESGVATGYRARYALRSKPAAGQSSNQSGRRCRAAGVMRCAVGRLFLLMIL